MITRQFSVVLKWLRLVNGYMVGIPNDIGLEWIVHHCVRNCVTAFFDIHMGPHDCKVSFFLTGNCRRANPRV